MRKMLTKLLVRSCLNYYLNENFSNHHHQYHQYQYHPAVSPIIIISITSITQHHHQYHQYHPSSSVSLSSCRAISTDITDPFSPSLLIFHHFRQVLRATPHMFTVLLYVGSSWSPCFCSAIWKRSIRVHLLWARSCFCSSVLHVWLV